MFTNFIHRFAGLAVFALCVSSPRAHAQPAALIYRLGSDTAAIEQFTRTRTGITGEMVQRTGATVALWRYAVTLAPDGRLTGAQLARVPVEGALPPTVPRETRFTVSADSIIREVVFADSVQRRAFAAARGMVNFPVYVYGPMELLAERRNAKQPSDSIPAVGAAGNLGIAGLQVGSDGALRQRGGGYPMVLRFDAAARLQAVDGSGTTNKVMATRQPGGLDLLAFARSTRPTGVLSARETARAGFGAGGMVLVDYGRPSVRNRSVWGGTLVPFDSVWRAGANDATHLFTTRTLTMGTLVVPPGSYSLWVQHTRQGTFLIVNAQTGQWGTQYDAARDVGRVAIEMNRAASFAEVFTVRVLPEGGTRGALELSWGDMVGRVPFTATAR